MNVSDAANFFKTEYPYTSYNYFVITETGMSSFSRISGLTLDSYELKPFVEGGRKDVHILQEQSKAFQTMTLEKGVGKMDFLQFLGPLKMLIIVCMSRNRAIKSVYFTTDAVLQKITLSDLNASDSRVLIKSATIAYNGLTSLPLAGLIPEEASQAVMSAADNLLSGSAAQNTASQGKKNSQSAKKSSADGLLEKYENVNSNAESIAAAEKEKEEKEEKELAALLEDSVDFSLTGGDIANGEK